MFGFEFKAGDAPQRTHSMMSAAKELKLEKLYVIYPGDVNDALDDRIEAVGIASLNQILPLLG